MTNLSDFLKVKKVRCVSIGNYKFITVGKEYDVVGLTRNSVFIVNDDESENLYPYKHFEPVLEPAENPLQDAELAPEFEAVEPKFKAGDRVYWGLKSRIFKVYRLMSTNVLEVELDGVLQASIKTNYALPLKKTTKNYVVCLSASTLSNRLSR